MKRPKTLSQAMAVRIAKVRKEGPTAATRSYVIRVYDTKGRLVDFFDSATLNTQAALEFVFLAARNSKVEKVEFDEECKAVEMLWKQNLRHGSAQPIPH